ncbi:YceI family protein [Pseudonocardia xinjiangensis]|uniref:YceI family protein n=1 Tax=Pseudonocardia xinjiangensis TaxID=75289 RepID=UPI003D8CECF9
MSIDIPPGRYALDPVHSSLQFATRFVGARVRGTFGELSGALEIAEDLTQSSVQVEIDVATVSTGDDHTGAFRVGFTASGRVSRSAFA